MGALQASKLKLEKIQATFGCALVLKKNIGEFARTARFTQYIAYIYGNNLNLYTHALKKCFAASQKSNTQTSSNQNMAQK